MTEQMMEISGLRGRGGVGSEEGALALLGNGGKGDVVFVDPSVPDYQEQIVGLEQWADVFILDPMQDGVEQISAEIKNRWELARIHILAPGMPGHVILGSASLCSQTLGFYARQIAIWGRALSLCGEIIFYGSEVGQGEKGEFLLHRISDLTQAGVSARRGTLNERLSLVA